MTDFEKEQARIMLDTVGFKAFVSYVDTRIDELLVEATGCPGDLAKVLSREQAIGALAELKQLVPSFVSNLKQD